MGGALSKIPFVDPRTDIRTDVNYNAVNRNTIRGTNKLKDQEYSVKNDTTNKYDKDVVYYPTDEELISTEYLENIDMETINARQGDSELNVNKNYQRYLALSMGLLVILGVTRYKLLSKN